MTTGEDRNKDRFKNWQLCGVWKLPFRHHGAMKLTQNWACFTYPCINLFIPTSVTLNTIPRYLNVFTCCSVLRHTCRIQCLGRLERHNASILLVIFVPAWLHAAENRSNACWRPCCEDPPLQHKFARKKHAGHPAVPNNDTLVDASVTVPAMSNPRSACGPVGSFVRPSLGFRCSKRSYILTTCSYFDNLEFDIFDASGSQCHTITSVTIAIRIRTLSV